MDTHKETIFTGSEVVETGKQAEGRKKNSTLQAIQRLSRGYSQSDTQQQPTQSQRKKQPNAH